jgi:hypothetical protein
MKSQVNIVIKMCADYWYKKGLVKLYVSTRFGLLECLIIIRASAVVLRICIPEHDGPLLLCYTIKYVDAK